MKKEKKVQDSPEKENIPEAAEKAVEQPQDSPEKEPVSELEQLKIDLADQQAKYLYLQAEYQNFRKRAARDISDARARAVEDTLLPFLSIADFLGMAGVAAEKSDNLDALKQGLMMIIAQFDKTLDEMGVRKFSGIGEKFDPALYDAVARENSDDVPEDVIISEWNCGYKIGEKLLRPARVTVSAGKNETEKSRE